MSTSYDQARRAASLAVLAAALTYSGCSDGDGAASGPVADAAAPADDARAAEPDGAPQLAWNGCTAADYQDRTGPEASRVIAIAVEGLSYTPRCMTISVGQSVRWEGSLSAHPLAAGSPGGVSAGSADSPIRGTSSGDSVEFTFAQPGVYPYYCELHAYGPGLGMAGSIHVR